MADEKRLMIWNVKMGNHEFTVETRDKHDWADDHSKDTVRVGAIAEIPWRDPIAMKDVIRHREATSPMDAWNEPREVTHKRAIEFMAHNNGFTKIEDGDIVAVFEAVKTGEAD